MIVFSQPLIAKSKIHPASVYFYPLQHHTRSRHHRLSPGPLLRAPDFFSGWIFELLQSIIFSLQDRVNFLKLCQAAFLLKALADVSLYLKRPYWLLTVSCKLDMFWLLPESICITSPLSFRTASWVFLLVLEHWMHSFPRGFTLVILWVWTLFHVWFLLIM